MKTWRKILAFALSLWLPIVSLEAKTLPDTAAVQQKVQGLGVGADVKVRLADGKKLRGNIQSIEDNVFQLRVKRNTEPLTLSYARIAELKLSDVYYRATDQPDPIEAHRTVVGLGVGKHVMVRLPSGRKVHGDIQSITEENFTVLPDHQARALTVAYEDVYQVEPNLSRTGWIVFAVACAAFAGLVAWAATHTQ